MGVTKTAAYTFELPQRRTRVEFQQAAFARGLMESWAELRAEVNWAAGPHVHNRRGS